MSPWLGFLDLERSSEVPPESLCEEASKVDFRRAYVSITALAKLLNQAQFKEDRLILKTVCVTVISSGGKVAVERSDLQVGRLVWLWTADQSCSSDLEVQPP